MEDRGYNILKKDNKKGKKHGIRKNRRTIQGFAQQGLSEGALC